MTNGKFDDILNQIQNQQPDPQAVAEAGDRVRTRLFGPGAHNAAELRNCEDFRSLFSAYLARSLSDARRMLLDDHLSSCVACRKAFDQTRGAVSSKIHPLPVAAARPGTPKWAIAAAVVAGLGLSAFGAWKMLDPAAGIQATVLAIDGTLYRVTARGSVPAGQADEIANREAVRTPAASRAVLKLADGSRIEVGERAEIAISRGWRGTTIQLERGHIIVQAARQKTGRLYVATGDSLVSVKGTIFSVNRGTLGSRVSVVEGEVQVDHNGRSESLKPGGQTATHPAIERTAVQDEISWSRDAARYTALLAELNALQRSFEAIPSAGLRYQSKLLLFTPEDTRIFAAIPNMSVQLVEMRRILDERLRASDVLRQWWNSSENNNLRRDVDQLLTLLQQLSGYLGEEIVLSVGGPGKEMHPLIVAEVRGSGLAEFLASLQAMGGFAYAIQDNYVLIADDAPRLQLARAILARGGSNSTPLRQRVEQLYRNGAGMLLCADMEHFVRANVPSETVNLGFDSVQFLLVERRDVAGKVDNRATLTFNGERKGLASWLGAPSAMGALNFISPEASGAAAVVVRQPRALVEEIFSLARRGGAQFDQELADIEARTGIRILDDLASSLGTEGAFALDGPVFPIPSWKAVLEVNAPQRIQTTIEKLLELARQHPSERTGELSLAKEQIGARMFYTIKASKLPFELHYTFVDAYLVAAANRQLLTQAIQNRQNGLTLVQSAQFRSLLPSSANPNFSAVFYHNMGAAVGAAAEQLQNLANLSDEQKRMMQAVRETPPGLIGIYGEADRISAATTGAFAGLNLGVLAGGDPAALFLGPMRR